MQASFKGKSKKVAIKNSLSGIYEPEEVQQHTASSLIATPMGKALRGNNINYSYFIQSKVIDLVEMLGIAVILMILFYWNTKPTSIALFMTIWDKFL